MQYQKYQHIEKLDHENVEGLLNGLCFIFSKLDGSNSSVWLENGLIKAGSRNRELTLDNDNAGFYNYISKLENIKEFFNKYPNIRLYGEFLVRHTLKTYIDTAWNKFYVFDVIENDKYVPYEDYVDILKEFDIDFIPALYKIENPTVDTLIDLMYKNTYLIKEGQGINEGLVIKRYDFINKYGRITWGKLVSSDFKAKHLSVSRTQEIKCKDTVEEKIVNEYVTEPFITKEYAKIMVEKNGWNIQYIPYLLNVVYHTLINEELWTILKKYKNPTINFSELHQLTIRKVKQIKSELF